MTIAREAKRPNGWNYCLFGLVAALSMGPSGVAAAGEITAFSPAVYARGADLDCLRGAAAETLAVVACAERCAPIPWQLDERDADGRLVLDQGPEPNPDDSPGVLDDADEIGWMLADAGRRMRPDEIPPGSRCAIEIALHQGDFAGWVYALSGPAPAPRAPDSYVQYDAVRDVIAGARVSMGFGSATPRYLALKGPPGAPERNLLDRLKVRAAARFLGVIPLWRDEDDLVTEIVGWRVGPIRVVRRQRQWVRLGWGLRTPIFRTDTVFYRDCADLPVHLRLNFPPTYFFGGIEIQGVLDFHDLRGWGVLAPGMVTPLPIGAMGAAEREALNERPGDWFALIGPDVTLVQVLTTGPTLASLRRRLVYREDSGGEPPESVRGELPGVGYRLTDWGGVDAGAHWFTSTSCALAAGADVERFLAARQLPVALESHALALPPSPASPSRLTGSPAP